MLSDLKYAIRMLTRSLGFTVVAVLTLALGIGACTAMFSLVNAVLLRPLPFHQPERLVWIENNLRGDTLSHRTSRVDDFLEWRAQAKAFEALAAYHAFFQLTRYSLTGIGDPQGVHGVQVSQDFLSVLGVQPLLGRGFVTEECVLNGRRAAILSHGFWQRTFAGATDVIGRSMTVNGESAAIVGVLPPSADLDVLFSPGADVELLLPLPLTRAMANQGNTVFGIGRLRPGVALVQAQEELAVINARIRERNPERVSQGGAGFGARVTLLEEHVRGHYRPAFVLLSGAVLCVLLIACVNLSNLLLVRANGRRQEFSVRTALGAGRWHIVRQSMTESLVLSVAGCVPGVLGASFAILPLGGLQALSIPLLRTAAVDTATLVVAVALTGTAALLCGVLPALQLWRRDVNEGLHDAGARGGTGRGSAWTRKALVVVETALGCLLLVGAGLLIRSFVSVMRVDHGFQPEHAFAWRVNATRPFNSLAERVAFCDRLAERVSAVPGVESVGWSDTLPLGFMRAWAIQAVSGVPYAPGSNPTGSVWMVDERYMQTMRMPLRAGRYFDARETEQSLRAIVLSETMARNLWPGRDPIGQTIAPGDGREYTVVGVVGDVSHGLEAAPQPDMYLSMRQTDLWSVAELVVRAKRAPAPLVADVRAAMREFDPAMASNEFTTLDQILDRAIAPRRIVTGMLSSFSLSALLLAALGLYGVIAYSVSQRTREIGTRLAIGAQRRDVLRLVVGEGLRLAGVGVGAGLVAALFVTRVLQSELYGVAPTDPVAFAGAGVVLIAVALLAAWIPAWRAAKVDPMAALRWE
jgi:putative ABC transport system permease protein